MSESSLDKVLRLASRSVRTYYRRSKSGKLGRVGGYVSPISVAGTKILPSALPKVLKNFLGQRITIRTTANTYEGTVLYSNNESVTLRTQVQRPRGFSGPKYKNFSVKLKDIRSLIPR